MSTGRKSQLDKFNARMSKKAAVDNHIAEQNAMAIMQQGKTDNEKAVAAAEKAGFKRTTEDVAMVLFRDSIEPFINIWTNSVDSKMHNVMEEVVMPQMRNEIRDMVQDIVREVVQDEVQQALRGAVAGIQQAMMPLMQQVQFHNSPIPGLDTDGDKEEPVFKNGLQQLAEEKEEKKDPEYKKPRYAKARVMSCGHCGQSGHNKRGCPELKAQQ